MNCCLNPHKSPLIKTRLLASSVFSSHSPRGHLSSFPRQPLGRPPPSGPQCGVSPHPSPPLRPRAAQNFGHPGSASALGAAPLRRLSPGGAHLQHGDSAYRGGGTHALLHLQGAQPAGHAGQGTVPRWHRAAAQQRLGGMLSLTPPIPQSFTHALLPNHNKHYHHPPKKEKKAP